MAYALYTQSFGVSNALAEVFITEAVTGKPAVVLASATGGVLSDRGQARLDSSGNLSVYIDTARTWEFRVSDGDTKVPVSSVVPGDGIPSAFTSRSLTDADDGDSLICATAQTATVNTGLVSGFGCAFKGAISFDGTATVTDVRTTGAANPWCALVQTGTDTYDAVGGKA